MRQRQVLLREAGVDTIDPDETKECRMIRTSREVCGCICTSYCDPDSCSCAQDGITCLVDHDNFPCGCTAEGCGNQIGRLEHNPIRVRAHWTKTVTRIELENKHNGQMAGGSNLCQESPNNNNVFDNNTSFNESGAGNPFTSTLGASLQPVKKI
ncbi:unnamed protein product [Orchesella dallaii]|uniref:Cysteine/serine-rich nuclear protein N-terminal domain-containing protein n=1 Tax=Orchesella dallaii TaxID=48710 RepID=A0ABP1R4A8_9HEXA